MIHMILINTGDGKGKTTAALGVALRSLGYGKRIAMIQFIKGTWQSGEDLFGDECNTSAKNFTLIKTGKGFVNLPGDTIPFTEHKRAAEEGLKKAKKIILTKKCDLVILDEINNAVDLKLISVKKVVELLRQIPEGIDVILTGRNAPRSFIALADTATEMREIKHAFNKRIVAKKGIDF